MEKKKSWYLPFKSNLISKGGFSIKFILVVDGKIVQSPRFFFSLRTIIKRAFYTTQEADAGRQQIQGLCGLQMRIKVVLSNLARSCLSILKKQRLETCSLVENLSSTLEDLCLTQTSRTVNKKSESTQLRIILIFRKA